MSNNKAVKKRNRGDFGFVKPEEIQVATVIKTKACSLLNCLPPRLCKLVASGHIELVTIPGKRHQEVSAQSLFAYITGELRKTEELLKSQKHAVSYLFDMIERKERSYDSGNMNDAEKVLASWN